MIWRVGVDPPIDLMNVKTVPCKQMSHNTMFSITIKPPPQDHRKAEEDIQEERKRRLQRAKERLDSVNAKIDAIASTIRS